MAKSRSSSKSSSSKSSGKTGGISITMILLAVLLGLIVCSLMNNKPLIEGATLTDGVCKGKISTTQDRLCNHLTDPDNCNTGEGKNVCTWRKSDDIYSYSGGLEGMIYYDWMGALRDSTGQRVFSIPSTGPNAGVPTKSPKLSAAEDTKLIPLRIPGRDGVAANYDLSSAMPDANDGSLTPQIGIFDGGDFLKAVLNIERSSDVATSGAVPSNLKDELEDIIKECESGWTKDSDVYKANYNRPIMGYNQSDGLVCRNPYYYPVVQPGSVPRVWGGSAGYGCPTPTNTQCEKRTSRCNWSSEGAVTDTLTTLYNNTPFTSAGQCGLDSCAAEYPMQCLKTNSINTVKDGFSWVYSSLPDAPQIG